MSIFEQIKQDTGYHDLIKSHFWDDFHICFHGQDYLQSLNDVIPNDDLFKVVSARILKDNEARESSDLLGFKPILTRILVKTLYKNLLETFEGIQVALEELNSQQEDNAYYENVNKPVILGRETQVSRCYKLITWRVDGSYIYLTFEALGFDVWGGSNPTF
ncbi:hypothetical protein CKF54_00455 [Psittacicella hinzii]|uniref:Uncharacterized protein n=1 Tax=Psittacicella hinzii TaxID=2028575 RepID=A0A3A1YAD6_9GAMM|nr:hypothetical protein [Psittacicella hinzii]RIY34501.1 hypothetical protein CKF54_00455 [Psittacicella hinzii]